MLGEIQEKEMSKSRRLTGEGEAMRSSPTQINELPEIDKPFLQMRADRTALTRPSILRVKTEFGDDMDDRSVAHIDAIEALNYKPRQRMMSSSDEDSYSSGDLDTDKEL